MMLRFSSAVMRMDRIRNKYTRGKAQFGGLLEKLGWFGHVQRWDSEYVDEGC